MKNPISVAVTGANGRMGKELLNLCSGIPELLLCAAFVREDSLLIGEAVEKLSDEISSDIKYSSQSNLLIEHIDAVIDFTLPNNAIDNLNRCIKTKSAMVIGTTGFSIEQQQQINEAATHIAILQSSNMSIGINLTFNLLQKVSRSLNNDPKVIISETHHIHKIDSPSGTAITMGEVIANSSGKNLKDCMLIDDLQTKPAEAGKIVFHSIREGEIIGDHSVKFITDDETIEITHRSHNRQIYAKGAIKAAQWLANKKPGLYSIQDMLEF